MGVLGALVNLLPLRSVAKCALIAPRPEQTSPHRHSTLTGLTAIFIRGLENMVLSCATIQLGLETETKYVPGEKIPLAN